VNLSSRISFVITLTAAVLVCKHALAVAVQGAPDLTGFDKQTRDSIELACGVQYGNGPAAYGECLRKQIESVRSSPGIPSLSGLDAATRESIELACGVQYGNGPAAYAECLRAQLQSIGIQPDAARVQSSRPKHTSRKAAPNSPSLTTDRYQAAPHQPRAAPSPWQDPGVWALIIVGTVLFIYLTPILWVLLSSRSRGGAKLGWFLVVVFFSWLGLAVFLIVTQAQRNRPEPEPY
jgi:hypothetical protein